MYNDARYALSRLKETLVLYKRQPVFVHDADDTKNGVVLVGTHFFTGEALRPHLSETIIANFPLGYVNLQDGIARYIYRMPLRKDWRQGLRSNNVFSSDGPCPMEVIAKCLTQVFPTFAICKDRTKKDRGLVMAWNNNYALSKGGILLHRGLDIGHVTKNGFELDKSFEYLREDLEDATL